MSTPTTRQLIPVSELLFDLKNPRLKEQPPNQRAAIVAIAQQQGRKLLALADDIARFGVDPITLTAVTPEEEGSGNRYLVLEGNRRLAAIRAAETPALVEEAFKGSDKKKLQRVHDQFLNNPTSEIECVVFEDEADARRWVELRHTGPGRGEGLVAWGAEEKDRHRRRHGSTSPAGEMIDFVRRGGGLSERAQQSDKGVLTNVKRLLSTQEVRDVLGIEKRSGVLYSHYPADEVAKGLTKVVEDLLTEKIKVPDIYSKDQRIDYANNLPKDRLPDEGKKLKVPKPLTDLGDANLGGSKKRKRRRKDRSRDRPSLIPTDLHLDISPNRIHDIYGELKKLPLASFPNAISVSFRVFLELSVDDHLDRNGLSPKNANLAQRMKLAADHMYQGGAGPLSLDAKRAVDEAANNRLGIASAITLHQYVHNPHVFPDQVSLRNAWDQLQPFFEQLWPPKGS